MTTKHVSQNMEGYHFVPIIKSWASIYKTTSECFDGPLYSK